MHGHLDVKQAQISECFLLHFTETNILCTFSSSSVGTVANATDVMQPLRLIVQPYSPLWLVIPTFAIRCLHACNDARDPSSEV